MSKKPPLYLLDSNVVISLAKYGSCKSVDRLMQIDRIQRKDRAIMIARLYNLIENGTIRVGVTATVVDELLKTSHHKNDIVMKYLETNPKLLKISLSEEQYRASVELARLYFSRGVNGEHAFNRHIGVENGENDAHIKAQASILGKDILTFDKHFKEHDDVVRKVNAYFKEKGENREFAHPRIAEVKSYSPVQIVDKINYRMKKQ